MWYREAGHREEFLQAVFTPQGAQHLSVKQMHTASVNYNLPAERSHHADVWCEGEMGVATDVSIPPSVGPARSLAPLTSFTLFVHTAAMCEHRKSISNRVCDRPKFLRGAPPQEFFLSVSV